jgi:hypothetical protein
LVRAVAGGSQDLTCRPCGQRCNSGHEEIVWCRGDPVSGWICERKNVAADHRVEASATGVGQDEKIEPL